MLKIRVAHDPAAKIGARVLAGAAAVAFVMCLIDYFMPHGPIAHQWGTLLVVVSTALMVWAAGWIGFGTWIGLGAMSGWLSRLFEVLLILDILATAFCAYMLEAPLVLLLMFVALAGWAFHIARLSLRASAS